MTEIIEAIDNWTNNRYAGPYDVKLFGFCELIRKTSGGSSADAAAVEQIFPVTIPDREHVAIKDRYNFITWIRWAQPVTYEESTEWSFGTEDARVGIIPLRIVLAHKASLGEDLVFDFVNAFPTKFSVPGFQFVFTDVKPTIDPDHEAIIQAELGPANYVAYEKHRLPWNIYVLNLQMQFLECAELTP